MITRFNNKTWEELSEYKNKKKIEGALYGVPRRISSNIPIKSKLIVLEMNNDTNTIMGVGLIRNYLRMDENHAIYSCGNYHRFTYRGKKRISREDFNRDEEIMIEKMEEKIFKGKGHLKRGQGIQKVPYERYSNEELEVFTKMFQCR